MLHIVLSAVQFISCAFIIGLVLIQRGKGADAGEGFGAGASGTVFGARGAGTALSRATAVLVAVFMVNSLALAYIGTKKAEAPKTILIRRRDGACGIKPAQFRGARASANSGTCGEFCTAAPAAPAGSAPK